MSILSPADLEALRRVGRLVAQIVNEMFEALHPGMTTRELDAVGRRLLEDAGARSAPRSCYGFEGWTIISVNEQAAHAVPSERPLQEGDLVNIDVSAELGGFFADTGASRPLGTPDRQAEALCRAGRRALTEALAVARDGRRISDVADVVRRVARETGHTVLENLAGHGIGRHLHEEPANVPRYWDRRDRRRFRAGTVLTIEPFLSTGACRAEVADDGWTLMTPPGTRNVQYEHTIVVTESDPMILTAL